MYISEIDIHFEPHNFEQINARTPSILEQMRGVPGCRRIILMRRAPGLVTSIAVYETQVHAEAATSTVAAIFGELAKFLTELPQRRIYPILYDVDF